MPVAIATNGTGIITYLSILSMTRLTAWCCDGSWFVQLMSSMQKAAPSQPHPETTCSANSQFLWLLDNTCRDLRAVLASMPSFHPEVSAKSLVETGLFKVELDVPRRVGTGR